MRQNFWCCRSGVVQPCEAELGFFKLQLQISTCKMFENLSTIVSEKLEKYNFQAWKFRIKKFLMGKGVWPFINGDEQEPILDAAPTIVELKTFKEWHEKAKKVMYWLSVSVLESMIVHI